MLEQGVAAGPAQGPPAPADTPGGDTARGWRRLFPLVSLPFWAAIGFRTVADVAPVAGRAEWLALAALLAYGVLLAAERPLSRRLPRFPPLYLALQTVLVLALFLLVGDPGRDYFATLFIPVSAQAVFLTPRPVGYRWLALVVAAMAVGLLAALGWPASLPFLVLYTGSYLFVASYTSLLTQAETAREQSRRLLADLQAAYRRLEDSAAQAEALAAAEARTRLARDLHDSVTQTLFGLTLSAEAASRALAQGEPATAADRLADVRETARQALAELRLIVFELRPAVDAGAGAGLAASLRARLAAVEARAGLATDLSVEGEDRLPPAVEGELERIAGEALNNALKHARARRVAVHLRQTRPTASLAVADDGVGFDPAAAGGGLGLRGMAERAAGIGASLAIASKPGAGTRIRVEVPR